MTETARELVETLAISNRVTLYLLEAVADEGLAIVPRKGWGLAAQFAHIHNVRIMWLDASKRAATVEKTATKADASNALPSRADLVVALSASALDLEGLVADTLASGTRLPGFKPHTTAFVGYFCAHQAYHHAEIGIVAKELGFPIDKKTAFGMWEWGVR